MTARINGVAIPTQLTLAVLNQLKAKLIAKHKKGRNGYLCCFINEVFNYSRWTECPEWWVKFMQAVGIPTVLAFTFDPIEDRRMEWLKEYLRKGLHAYSDAESDRNKRRMIFLDLLIYEVSKCDTSS
jgi:hypothetical protein